MFGFVSRISLYFSILSFCFFFFFNATATTEIYTLSLHDALPISAALTDNISAGIVVDGQRAGARLVRSEEHTSELQSRPHLVCRLLLEKKKKPSDCTEFPSARLP